MTLKLLHSEGPKLILFLKSVAIYFIVLIPYENPCHMAVVLKCSPVISLMFFIVLHGISFSDEHRYSLNILKGLGFSCLGDACLIFRRLFEVGIIFFMIGHMHYICAFGFKPLSWFVGLPWLTIGVVYISYVWTGITATALKIAVSIYICIIMMMSWRATARYYSAGTKRTNGQLCALIGAIFFVISDSLIGISHFKYDIPYDQILIMSTYYIAQLGIALSIVDYASIKKIKNFINVKTCDAKYQKLQ